MSAISLPNPASLHGNPAEVQAQLQSAFQVDGRCLNFGPFAVLIRPEEFLAQLEKALMRSKYDYRATKVEYYDETTFHGKFEDHDVPFRKQSKFAYQNEYRVRVITDEIVDGPITLEIGDMSGFAYKMVAADLNKSLRVNLKEP